MTPTTSATRNKKRKREDEEEQAVLIKLLSSFSDIGLVVGLSGNELIAMQLEDTLRRSKRKKSHGTLLADVMGKGSLKDTNYLHKAEEKARKWEEWTAKVDRMIEADDMEGLEKLVANDQKLGKQRGDGIPCEWEEANDMHDGHQVAYEELWPLPEPFDPNDLNRPKVLYIVGKVFAYADPQDGRLELVIPSAKLVEWLALTGFLSIAYVKKALSQSTETDLQSGLVQLGDIMAAIRQIDEDFQLMHHLLSLPVHWELEELVQALRILVHSFDSDPQHEQPLALPAPPQQNDDTDMVNGDADSHLDLESKVAEHELDYAMNALTTGLEVRSDTLRMVFARLHAFSQPLITATMRAMMSHRELVFFIHILRIELADAGWTSKYVDGGEVESTEEGMVNVLGGVEEIGPSDQAIKVIGDLLNCAVDAIGVSGWLIGLGSDAQSTRELLNSLRAEVSAGLETCFEADTLQTYLKDVERYEATSEQGQLLASKHAVEEGDETGTEMALLPVGGRAAPPIVKGRNDKGGKKSKMALAREKSMAVGKYSFERIRI